MHQTYLLADWSALLSCVTTEQRQNLLCIDWVEVVQMRSVTDVFVSTADSVGRVPMWNAHSANDEKKVSKSKGIQNDGSASCALHKNPLKPAWHSSNWGTLGFILLYLPGLKY